MRKTVLIILPVLLTLLLATSCDPTVKLAKSDNIADKDTAAMRFVRAGKCEQANYILEELLSIYRMQERGEEIYYYYSYCKYKMGEYLAAAYYFDDFVRQYPRSEHSEEFRYLSAYSYFLMSPPWYLDQKFTYEAMDRLQLFVDQNPQSKYVKDCNQNINDLREKLAQKSFEQATLYYKISYYKSAVQALQITLNEFPDSKYAEESQFLLFKSSKLLADESIPNLKKERYKEALAYHQKFDDKFPDSKFAKDGLSLTKEIEKSLNKIKNEEENGKGPASKRSIILKSN